MLAITHAATFNEEFEKFGVERLRIQEKVVCE